MGEKIAFHSPAPPLPMERLLPLIHEAGGHVLDCLVEGKDVDSLKNVPAEIQALLPATLSRPMESDEGMWNQMIEFRPDYWLCVTAPTLDELSRLTRRELGKRIGREYYNLLCADLIVPINLA